MRHDELHVVDVHVGTLAHLVNGVAHRIGSKLEDGLPVHKEGLAWTTGGDSLSHAKFLVDARIARITRNGSFPRDAVRAEGLRRVERRGAGKRVGIVIVVLHVGGEHARAVLVPFDHGSPAAIAEEHAGRAVLPVGDARQALGADHERTANLVATAGARNARRACRHHRFRHAHRVDETRARGVHVESHGVHQAQATTDERRARGHEHVGRAGGIHHKVDRLGIDRSLAIAAFDKAHRLTRGSFSQIDVRFLNGDATGFDARARGDPLVARVDKLGKVVVRDGERGKGFPATDDCAAH